MIGLTWLRVAGMLNPFCKKNVSLATSKGIIDAARKAAANEACCAVDEQIDGHFHSARIRRTVSRKLHCLADLLERRRNRDELTPGERIAVRCALDTLREKLNKK